MCRTLEPAAPLMDDPLLSYSWCVMCSLIDETYSAGIGQFLADYLKLSEVQFVKKKVDFWAWFPTHQMLALWDGGSPTYHPKASAFDGLRLKNQLSSKLDLWINAWINDYLYYVDSVQCHIFLSWNQRDINILTECFHDSFILCLDRYSTWSHVRGHILILTICSGVTIPPMSALLSSSPIWGLPKHLSD